MSKTVKIAMIGTGDISGIYLKNITETFHEIELTGTTYSIYVNQDSENGVMDVFMETK